MNGIDRTSSTSNSSATSTAPPRGPAPSSPASNPTPWSGLAPRQAPPLPPQAARPRRTACLPGQTSRQVLKTGLLAAGQASAQVGGLHGQLGDVVCSGLAGAIGADNLKDAGIGAVKGATTAMIKDGTVLAIAAEAVNLGAHVASGAVSKGQALQQGAHLAANFAGAMLPGGVGKAINVATSAVRGAAGAATVSEAVAGAATGALIGLAQQALLDPSVKPA